MRKGIRLGASGLLVAMAVADYPAPSAAAGDGPATLAGTQWRPVVLEGHAVQDSGRAILGFSEGGALQANDGCNGVGGTWSAEGSALTIALGPSTLMACPPPVDALASSFRNALASTRRFARDSGRLSLLGENGQALAAFAPTEPASLAGSSWIARAVNNGRQGVEGVPEDVGITMRFGTDGTVSGNAGCNHFDGSYTAKGKSLSFSPLRSTRKACPGEAMEQETRFLAALGRVASHQLGQRELDLFDAEGARQATLALAP